MTGHTQDTIGIWRHAGGWELHLRRDGYSFFQGPNDEQFEATDFTNMENCEDWAQSRGYARVEPEP